MPLYDDFVIRIMFFYIFPLFFQELVQILLIKHSRVGDDRDIFFFFLLLCVRLLRLFFLCLSLAGEPQHAGEEYGEYV